jgi:hypothetical protein
MRLKVLRAINRNVISEDRIYDINGIMITINIEEGNVTKVRGHYLNKTIELTDEISTVNLYLNSSVEGSLMQRLCKPIEDIGEYSVIVMKRYAIHGNFDIRHVFIADVFSYILANKFVILFNECMPFEFSYYDSNRLVMASQIKQLQIASTALFRISSFKILFKCNLDMYNIWLNAFIEGDVIDNNQMITDVITGCTEYCIKITTQFDIIKRIEEIESKLFK